MTLSSAPMVSAAPEDIINTSAKGSITIHKYDFTAAQADNVSMGWTSNGKTNAEAEAALADYVIPGVEFTYMKVSDIITESVGGKIKVMYYIPPELEKVLNLTDSRGDHQHTSDEINDGLKHLLESDNVEAKNKLEDYVVKGHGNVQMQETNEQGITTATNLDLGLYLIVETKVPANVHTTVDPFFVSVPMTDLEGEAWFYDVVLYPKNQTNFPTLDKQVRQHDDAELYNRKEYHDTATVSEGDKADYIIVSHLPKITSTASYLVDYTFTDYLAKGLAYNKNEQIYIYGSEADAFENDPSKAEYTFASSEYTAAYTTEGRAGDPGRMEGPSFYGMQAASPQAMPVASGSSWSDSGKFANRGKAVFSFTAAGLKKINPGFSEKWLVISYSATVHSDNSPILGDTGNTNDVQLVWKRTNERHPDHEEARARVYTFGLDIKKEFTQDDEHKNPDPTKVKFSLQNKTDGHFIVASQKAPGSGLYYVTDNVKGTAEKDGTVFVPGPDGTLVVNGLEADTYILTELETEDGYTLLKEPIEIVINCTVDTFTPSVTTLYDRKKIEGNPNAELIEENGNRASTTVDGKETNMNPHRLDDSESTHAYVDMTITNTPGFKLPATGGMGTILFTLAGCGVAFLGVLLLTKKDKKGQSRA